jgi:hypothetical protein
MGTLGMNTKFWRGNVLQNLHLKDLEGYGSLVDRLCGWKVDATGPVSFPTAVFRISGVEPLLRYHRVRLICHFQALCRNLRVFC